MGEAESIRATYEAGYAVADGRAWDAPWSPRNPTAIYFRQQIERAVVAVLNEARVELRGADVLDVGCGSGPYLRYFAEVGAARGRLHGIDLVPERIEAARELTPDADLRVADAANLPFDEGSFDVVSQFTALCNIRDDAVLRAAAAEILRVLRPGGILLWVDIMRGGAGAPYRPITPPHVRELFPPLEFAAQRALFHRWSAMLAARVPEVAIALERLPLPKSHLVAVLRAPP